MRSLHDKRNKTQTSFRGWDWTELSEWLDVKDELELNFFGKVKIVLAKCKIFFLKCCYEYNKLFKWSLIADSEEVLLYNIRKVLQELASERFYRNSNSEKLCKLTEEELKEKIGGIRTFVKRLSEGKHSYTTPLWNGLYRIKSDEEFLRYVEELLPHLWD